MKIFGSSSWTANSPLGPTELLAAVRSAVESERLFPWTGAFASDEDREVEVAQLAQRSRPGASPVVLVEVIIRRAANGSVIEVRAAPPKGLLLRLLACVAPLLALFTYMGRGNATDAMNALGLGVCTLGAMGGLFLYSASEGARRTRSFLEPVIRATLNSTLEREGRWPPPRKSHPVDLGSMKE